LAIGLESWTTYAAAGGIVLNDERLLLVRQRRHYGTHWELPSGYCEPGESFEEATAREVLEETGIAVEVGDLVCTLVWERERDRRRNLLAFFSATPIDPTAEPRPQLDEDIDAAGYLDDAELGETALHPLDVALLERMRAGLSGFHFHAHITVHGDGTQSYVFHDDAP
jgi:ADP-ribose pyrophosphatase YjhB (NUDIX family)